MVKQQRDDLYGHLFINGYSMNDKIINVINNQDLIINLETIQYKIKYSFVCKYNVYEFNINNLNPTIQYKSDSSSIIPKYNSKFIRHKIKIDKYLKDNYKFNKYKYESLSQYKLITMHEDNK